MKIYQHLYTRKSCFYFRSQLYTDKIKKEASKIDDISREIFLTKYEENKNNEDEYYEEVINEFKVNEIQYTTSSENLFKTNNETIHCIDTKNTCELLLKLL